MIGYSKTAVLFAFAFAPRFYFSGGFVCRWQIATVIKGNTYSKMSVKPQRQANRTRKRGRFCVFSLTKRKGKHSALTGNDVL